MRVDVIDVLGTHPRLAHRVLHAEFGTQPFRMRCSNVVRITAHATTKNFGIDLRPACDRVFEIFEDHRCTALAEYKAIAVLVIGP